MASDGGATREQSLDEYVGGLPSSHRARKELRELHATHARIRELEAKAEELLGRPTRSMRIAEEWARLNDWAREKAEAEVEALRAALDEHSPPGGEYTPYHQLAVELMEAHRQRDELRAELEAEVGRLRAGALVQSKLNLQDCERADAAEAALAKHEEKPDAE